jgi:spermidine synthase
MPGAVAVSPARISDSTARSGSLPNSKPWWYLFFFVSGFPALLYQIVWQRALFTLYGVNIESVTMVVTAFMLGLGLGSLLGGIVSKRQQWPLLGIFGLVELLIGGYGTLSLKVFHWAAEFTAGSSSVKTGVVAFTLVALPTVLMGATFPILVSYSVRVSHNVGTSVGALYAANTLGSAAACFCAGMFLMGMLGQARTVALAAGLNAFVGATVLLLQYAKRKSATNENRQADVPAASQPSVIGFPAALIIAAMAGFIALGYEIVWYRLFSFTTAGVAKDFAFLLGAYLTGIAFGSMVTNRVCKKSSDPRKFLGFLVGTVFGANLVGFLVGPSLFYLVTHLTFMWTLLPIAVAAACLGAIFPMLCHISIPADGSAGVRTSYLYLSNILGSALGSYLTGFVLMDIFTLRDVALVLALLGIGLGAVLLLTLKLSRVKFVISAAFALASALFIVRSSEPLFYHMYEKMLTKEAYVPEVQFQSVVETRSGVIAVLDNGIVFGGGIYDGRFNVSLVNDSNGLERAFALSYFHPNPREVLMIGLSSGSWAQVIANHPQVEHLTIVEINPGYLRLIARAKDVASILKNPKVNIDIDDGRRWLIRNAGKKYDAIVINTTYNWRSNISNLLSVEFLQLIRQHLNPGGVDFYNTTDSEEVMATGLRVFPYGMRVANFMLLSDSPLQLDAQRWMNVLTHYNIDGQPVFDLSQEAQRKRLNEVLALPDTLDRKVRGFYTLESADHIRARTTQTLIITDDNMGTEWLHTAAFP